MKRLIATMICDVRLQIRNGFYYAAAFVAVFWTFALSRIPPDRLTLWMPVFVLSNLPDQHVLLYGGSGAAGKG